MNDSSLTESDKVVESIEATACLGKGQRTLACLEMINACLLSLGGDFYENVNQITALCGKLFPATCALYNRLTKDELHSLGQWNTPPDYVPTDKPDGHLCYDVILRGVDELFVVRDLPNTPYAQSDPNVTRYNLKTYIGHPVKCHGIHVGSLCIVFQDDFIPSEEERRFMGILASAIRVEEERLHAQEEQAILLKKCECVNEELKAFAHTVSHDLKAPLRHIKTLVDWIVTDYRDTLDSSGQENLMLLSGRVDRMQDLINGILAYSKAGCVEDHKTEVNLTHLVRDIIDDICPDQPDAIHVTNQLPIVHCDKMKARQVFQNLLSNAVRHMDQSNGRVGISCEETEGIWTFGIADNGLGIAEEHFETIFHLFKTLTPKDDGESTGVGLSIVKRIVEAWGGKVWVESCINQGSIFYFTLPQRNSA